MSVNKDIVLFKVQSNKTKTIDEAKQNRQHTSFVFPSNEQQLLVVMLLLLFFMLRYVS